MMANAGANDATPGSQGTDALAVCSNETGLAPNVDPVAGDNQNNVVREAKEPNDNVATSGLGQLGLS